MASKLLSCLIIAVSCHHAIGPFTAPPIPVDVVDIPRTSNLQQPEVFDFQRYAPYKTLLGQDMFEAKVAPGLPPDDVFPQGTRKNFVATHITRWMLDPKTQWPYSILCSESQAQWAYIGVVYNSLVKRWRLDVRNYLINNGIVVSAKDMINVKRIEWFMARANRPVWWNGDLIRALYRRENRLLLNEDVCLGRVGDILEFETEESSFKFKASFSDVFEKFAQLDKVFALHRRNTVERTGGGERLLLFLLDQPDTNVHGRQLLFRTRMTALSNAAVSMVRRMSDVIKEKVIRVLCVAHGFQYNSKTEKLAKAVRRNLDSTEWKTLLAEKNWETAGQLLKDLSTLYIKNPPDWHKLSLREDHFI